MLRGIVTSSEGAVLSNAALAIPAGQEWHRFAVRPDGGFEIDEPLHFPVTIMVSAPGFFSRSIQVENPSFLRVALRERPAWSGVILDEENRQPLAGVSVRLSDELANENTSVSTGVQGDFLFANLDLKAYHLEASPPGHCPVRSDSRIATGRSHFTLLAARATDLRGRVRTPSGHAVPNARVALAVTRENGLDLHSLVETRTDTDGRFAISLLPAGHDILLAVGTDDGQIAHRQVHLPSGPVQLVTSPLVQLKACGAWMDTDDPVQGFGIELATRDPFPEQLRELGMLSLKSVGKQACVQLKALSGKYDLSFTAKGAAPLKMKDLDIGNAGEVSDLGSIQLSREAALGVQLIDPVGTAPSGGWVEVYSRKLGRTRVERVDADDDGRADLRGLPAGVYDLEVGASGHQTVWLEKIAIPGPDRTISLQSGGTLSGQVIDDETGAPIPEFQVSILPAALDPKKVDLRLLKLLSARIEYDDEGYFSIDGIPPGDYAVRASSAGYSSELIPYTMEDGGDFFVDISMTRASCASGLVLDARTRAGISNAVVDFADANASLLPGEQPRHLATTDVDGTFLLCELEEGNSMTVTVKHPGYAPEKRRLKTGQNEPVLLTEGTELRGELVDTEGRGVANWRIRLSGEGWSRETTSDSHGSFSLMHLPAGRVKLVVTDPLSRRYEDREVRHVELQAETVNEETIVLGRLLRGTVTRNGYPVGGVTVRAVKLQPGIGPGDDPTVRTTQSHEDGRYVLRHVSGGTYVLQVVLDEILVNRVVQVSEEDSEIDIELGSREIAGMTIDGDRQVSLPGVEIHSWTNDALNVWNLLLPDENGLSEVRVFSGDVSTTRSGRDGEFRLLLRPDAAGVLLEHPDFLDKGVPLNEFPPGQTSIVSLYRGGSLTINLLGVDGRTPCPGSVVLIAAREVLSQTTDALGSARFEGVRVGRYEAWGLCKSVAPTHLAGIEIEAGEDVSETITMTAGADVGLVFNGGSRDIGRRLTLHDEEFDIGNSILRQLQTEIEEGDEETFTVWFHQFPSGSFEIIDTDSGRSISFTVHDQDRLTIPMM